MVRLCCRCECVVQQPQSHGSATTRGSSETAGFSVVYRSKNEENNQGTTTQHTQRNKTVQMPRKQFTDIPREYLTHRVHSPHKPLQPHGMRQTAYAHRHTHQDNQCVITMRNKEGRLISLPPSTRPNHPMHTPTHPSVQPPPTR